MFSFKKQVREALTSGPLHAVEIAREVKIARNFKPCIDLCKEAIENAYQEIKKICVYVRLEIFLVYMCYILNRRKYIFLSFFLEKIQAIKNGASAVIAVGGDGTLHEVFQTSSSS